MFRPVDEREKRACRKRLGLPASGFLIGFCGRLVPENGLVELRDALRRLRAERADVHLALLGHGPLAQDPGFSPLPWISILGSRPHFDIPVFMQSLDLFILPSKPIRKRVDELLRSGQHWVVDADLKSYFDTIPHERLMERVGEKIADGKVLKLIEGMLRAGVMDSVKGWQATEQGSPQGAVISPLLSNIYLNGLDWKMARNGFEMVRYADDFVVLCSSQEEAQKALEQIKQWVEENGLKLHPTKTRLVDASQRGGFDFLGYHFERGRKWPRKKSLDKLKDTIRSKTRRSCGRSIKALRADLNPTLKGWFEYFKHSAPHVFKGIDGYVRGRLRSILRRQTKRKGRARGTDHHRWPNTYFSAVGLFSLEQARTAACRSS
jgi:RNA-directed DNA polymerase